MKKNNSTPKTLINFTGYHMEKTMSKITKGTLLIFLTLMFLNQATAGANHADNHIANLTGPGYFADSTESNVGINLPNIGPKPTSYNEANTNTPPATPELIFCLNGTPTTEGNNFLFCSTTPVELSLCDVIDGVAPFTICFELDSDPNCVTGIEPGDVILAEDFSPGNYNLQITSITDAIGNSLSNTESLSYTIGVINPPEVEAGQDATICESTGVVLNSASAVSFSTITWSAGDGTFIPSPDVLNPLYQPGSNDIANGIIEITLTANSVEPCSSPATDFMTLIIRNDAESDAGPDITVCEDQQYVELSGNIQNGLPIWEAVTYTGGFFEDPLTTSTRYYFSETDVELGTIQLCLIAIPSAPCVIPQFDCLEVTIVKSPDAYAGEDFTITDSEVVNLDQAAVENTTAIEWSTNGDGYFSDITEINPTYFPGQDDIAEGDVKLIITAMPEDGCTVNSMDLITIDIVQTESGASQNELSTVVEPDLFKSTPSSEEIPTIQPEIETNIFPNPASEFVNINANEQIRAIRILNSGGQQVLIKTIGDKTATIPVSNLKQGMYILRLEFQNQTRTTKKITIR